MYSCHKKINLGYIEDVVSSDSHIGLSSAEVIKRARWSRSFLDSINLLKEEELYVKI